MRFSAKVLLACALFPLVTGCGFVEKQREENRIYNPSLSYAANVARIMDLRVADAARPEGNIDPNNNEGNAAEMLLLSPVVGLAPFLFFARPAPAKDFTQPESKNNLLLYVPADAADNEQDASLAHMLKLRNILEKFFADKSPDYAELQISDIIIWKLLGIKFHFMEASFKNKNCSERIIRDAGKCIVTFTSKFSSSNVYLIRKPAWLDPAETPSWQNSTISIDFWKKNGDESEQVHSPNEYLFLEDLAKFLPDDALIYAAPRFTKNGNNVPMIISNKQIHYFVRPH
jgi:hypothetical protein